MNRCVVITSAGKSGSKRALKVFDLSPQTHCRCEPNALEGSRFDALPSREVLHPGNNEAMALQWDQAVEAAARCIGIRDHLPSPPKRYQWSVARQLRLYRLLKHAKLRRALSIAMPSLRGAEWPLPRWLGSRQALAQAALVLKIGPAAGWVPWLLEYRPQARIINIVRHPGGFLNSYIGRWLTNADRKKNAPRLNRARLHCVARFDRQWARRLDQIDRMSAVEAELWYWRYVYKTIHAAGRDNPQYLLVRDEDLVADPVGTAKRLYQFAGLDWCDSAQTYLEQIAEHWQTRTAPWQELLDDEHAEIVKRVLAGSALQSWWEPDQVVSLYDYVAYKARPAAARAYARHAHTR